MGKQKVIVGFYKKDGKTRPITKSTAKIRRKKLIKPNKSRWTLTYKRTRQLKQLSIHFLEKHKPKCYFCHEPLTKKDLPDNITDHHINGDRSDNRPSNKALCHETCHRQYHYDEVSPRNPGDGFIYYHATTEATAQNIKKSKEITLGTITKSKRLASRYGRRVMGENARAWQSSLTRPVLLKFKVNRNLGRAVDVGRKYQHGIEPVKITNITIIPLKPMK